MNTGETVFKHKARKTIRILTANTVTIPAIASPMWDFLKIGFLIIAVMLMGQVDFGCAFTSVNELVKIEPSNVESSR